MTSSIRRFLVIFASMILSNQVRAQSTFTSFDVPFADASDTKAFSINARGDIVGRYFDNSLAGKGNPRGFLRHPDGTFDPPIDVPVANTGTVLRGNNSGGDIVGKYFDPTNPLATHGFLLSSGGTFTSFDVPVDFDADPGSTVANSLNNPGEIVGFYNVTTSVDGCKLPLAHGFLRETDGTFTKIDFPDAVATVVRGIDDAGDIVGFYFVLPGPFSCEKSDAVEVHGFLRTPDGEYFRLDVPASTAVDAGVTRINDAGEVIGVYSTTAVTFGEVSSENLLNLLGTHNFALSRNGKFTSFDVPFSPNSSVLGVNARGNVVGVYFKDGHDHGFLGSK